MWYMKWTFKTDIVAIYVYGTDLMQRCTHMQVLGYHTPNTQTQSSVSFTGFELTLKLKLSSK